MKINPLSSRAPRLAMPLAACVLMGAFVPVTVFSQTTVRESDRDVRVRSDRDVRVVDPAHPLKRADREFMEKAARMSMSDVAISRIAAARTSNPDVRRFAQSMIDDHEEAVEQLAALAANLGVALPAKDPRPEKWEKRDSKHFDREYLEQMIDDHEKIVKTFAEHAKDGNDAATVAYARKFLPRLQQHLQHAVDLKRTLTEKRD